MITAIIHVVDGAAVDVDAAIVRIYSTDGVTFVTQGTTDADGLVSLELEDNTVYWIRCFKIGYEFPTRLSITTDSGQGNTFTVTATDLNAHPPATDANFCRASGTLLDSSGNRSRTSLRFALQNPPKIVNGLGIVQGTSVVHTDENGYVFVDLIRGAVYDVVVGNLEDRVWAAPIPDQSAVDIIDLLWPQISSVSFADEDVSVAEGATADTAVTVQLSSGVEVPYTADGLSGAEITKATAFIQFDVEDDDICAVTFDGLTNVLTIKGMAAGETTVTAVVKDVFIQRFADVDPVIGTITVTVT